MVVSAVLQSGLGLGPQTLPLLLVVAGLALTIAEALAPGAHFIVLGVALLAAGIVGTLVGPLAGPFVLALLVVAFGSLALYGYREFDLYSGTRTRTSDSDSLTGRAGQVTERVTPRSGAVKLDSGGFDPNYAARSMDGEIPVGEEVIVVDPGGGSVLTVATPDAGDDIDAELERARRERETAGADPDRESESE